MSPLPLPFSHWLLEKLEPRLSGWSLAVCRNKERKGSYSLKGEIILKTLSYYKVNEDNTCFFFAHNYLNYMVCNYFSDKVGDCCSFIVPLGCLIYRKAGTYTRVCENG